MWRTVSINENYEVNECGDVRSIATGLILKSRFDKDGYIRVNLYNHGKMQTAKVHRLVATAFCENPNGLSVVNHIDEDKANNNASNLEWCDIAYNNRYGTHPERVAESRRKPVIAYKDGVAVYYNSAKEAAHRLGIREQGIGLVARGKLKTTHGYRFEFA